MSLVVEGLSKQYSKQVQALNHISFRVNEGECIGIVGESGSGKSTLGRILLGLETYKEGSITYYGKTIAPRKRSDLRQFRKSVQMVFQDSTSTLNPKLPIWKSLLEPLDNFKEITPSFLKVEGLTRKEIAQELLEIVGLDKEMVDRYPGELSGGQKQRVSIARAISIEPSLLVCDEPTASLDVTVQVQILRLLKELQQKTNMTILFISHDIRAVSFLCDKVMVLKDGSIVDQFELSEIYDEGRHPYTKALIQAAKIE
ncbi:ABC transporter ATP-binding protein [Halalkalibacter alkaliphilus]|uniref:Dipeptide/oligopeptide/nickel ABC transporter ATP-binding protein n=1 Tax=Halalkalibacter alkaliphilus TaxID=2917993 RepID=A0A9X2A4E0_9BACI|nr:dipeptide/oligopeptide/nickel ABC transporter ATP-binding protein [Halalkalibacter alkaliphilus]MCL7746633.1 dipeptide/oligopeptide/nickel ABC transporter ATP-binding protein [Halalkalibacter alkaliphilus]